MSLIAMPMLLVNLGCEMLYILDQRLKAQDIPGDKSVKVLHDVVRTMFDAQFVEKMFDPQELYSVTSTRKIFERLAHSSIMRLSESSMEKLFDLMLMGVKYQLYCSNRLEQMMEVTKLHLDTIRSMMSSITDGNVVNLVTNVETKMKQAYGSMSFGQLHMLRQTLQRYFQDKRVKVSLFLQEGIQSTSGRLILPSPTAAVVGTVSYYSAPGAAATKEKLKLRSQEVDPIEFFIHPAPLGTNLYNKERAKVVPPTRTFDAAPPAASSSSALPVPVAKASGGAAAYAEEVIEKGGKDARKELELLTTLLAITSRAQEPDNFKLNLFGDDDMPVGSGGGAKPTVIFVDGANDAYKKSLAGAMMGMSIQQQSSAGDDLLDMMDNA